MENVERAITRQHHFDSSYLRAAFTYVNLVAAVAAYVSIVHGIRNSQILDTLIYHLVKDAAFGADITRPPYGEAAPPPRTSTRQRGGPTSSGA